MVSRETLLPPSPVRPPHPGGLIQQNSKAAHAMRYQSIFTRDFDFQYNIFMQEVV